MTRSVCVVSRAIVIELVVVSSWEEEEVRNDSQFSFVSLYTLCVIIVTWDLKVHGMVNRWCIHVGKIVS